MLSFRRRGRSCEKATMSSKHLHDLELCGKPAGATVGRVCEGCEGRCVLCDSFVRQMTPARVCDECDFGTLRGRCLVCGKDGAADAFYCQECTLLGHCHDGCPRVVNVGASRIDQVYQAKRLNRAAKAKSGR